MDDRIDTGDERVHSRRILQWRDDDFFAGARDVHRRDVADAQHMGELLQTGPQHLAEAARGAGEQQAFETRCARRRGGGSRGQGGRHGQR